MVGRSWYVLESSIRAHRFGGDPLAAPVETSAPAEQAPATPAGTWEKPTYVPEMIPSMPVPVAAPSEEQANAASTAETLTDMQAAWKEWFAQKQDTLIETPEIIDEREEEYIENKEESARTDEIEENIRAFKDAHQDREQEEEAAEPVSIQAIPAAEEPVAPAYEEIEAESEPVVIHHAPEPRYTAYQQEEIVPTKQERKRAAARARRERRAAARSNGAGSFIVQAVLIAIILITVVITAVGTGYAARFVHSGSIAQPVLDFLGGTSTYSK
jgi:DNA polymerase III gamma/tau subunit